MESKKNEVEEEEKEQWIFESAKKILDFYSFIYNAGIGDVIMRTRVMQNHSCEY